MKRFAIRMLLSALVICFLTSCGNKQIEFINYQDNELGINFDYPSDWEVKKSEGKLGVFSRSDNVFVLFSIFQNIPANETPMNAFNNVIVKPYRQKFNFKENILEEAKRVIQPAELQGVNADKGYKGQFNGTLDQRKAVFSVALFIKGTNGFQVFSAIKERVFDNYINDVIRIMNSFRIK